MRISTAMIFQGGIDGIQRRSAESVKLQKEIAANQRVLTPSDDPVGAAQALVVSQAQNLNTLFSKNQSTASDSLSLAASQLQSATTLLQRVHELTVQLGNIGSMKDADRLSITSELRQDFSELMGIANQQDASGSYLFSGLKGDTQPYTGTVDTGVTYNGDTGQRSLRVAASRTIAISDSGSDIFDSVVDKSQAFAVSADSRNTGTAAISAPTISDTNKWNSILNNKNYSVKFAVSGATTTYDIVDDNGMSLLTGAKAFSGAPLPGTYQAGQSISLAALSGLHPVVQAASTNAGNVSVTNATISNSATWSASKQNYSIRFTGAATYDVIDNLSGSSVSTGNTYTPGAAINVNGMSVTLSGNAPQNGDTIQVASAIGGQDFGAAVTISGSPSNGDTFFVRPESTVSVFSTLSSLIKAAESPMDNASDATKSAFQTQLNTALANILSAQDSVVRVSTTIGASLNELDSLKSLSSDLNIQYTATITRLTQSGTDDMTQAISELSQNQLSLQAAEMAYTKISQLSLFNYL